MQLCMQPSGKASPALLRSGKVRCSTNAGTEQLLPQDACCRVGFLSFLWPSKHPHIPVGSSDVQVASFLA